MQIDGVREGKTGDLIVSQERPPYYDATKNGRSFSLVLTATTTGVAAGNLVGAAAAASTQFALWNPAGSGYNIAIRKFFMGLISGTPVGGPMFHAVATTPPSIANVGTINNLLAGSSIASIAGCCASAAGAALTAGGAPAVLKPSGLYSTSATAFVNAAANSPAMEDLGGSIVLPPGTMWVPQFKGGGTALLNCYAVEWEEIPVG